MNKVFGKKTDFAPIKEDASRVIICYGYEEVDEENATWVEIYIYKKQISQITLDDVKKAIIADINAKTDEKILTGFVWNGKPVYLSKENQENYLGALTAAQLTEGASLPIKFKLGEDAEGKAVYHTFNSVNTLKQFYLEGVAYINQTLNEGWQEKDAINFEPYEAFFAAAEEQEQEVNE